MGSAGTCFGSCPKTQDSFGSFVRSPYRIVAFEVAASESDAAVAADRIQRPEIAIAATVVVAEAATFGFAGSCHKMGSVDGLQPQPCSQMAILDASMQMAKMFDGRSELVTPLGFAGLYTQNTLAGSFASPDGILNPVGFDVDSCQRLPVDSADSGEQPDFHHSVPEEARWLAARGAVSSSRRGT